ncbi:type II/IV secretion system protein [Candidatus Peregrinibacteria bacterium]|nr:MAG: type II/IV secretion system protein [Candidatus Peregrinibacteria bacterium]
MAILDVIKNEIAGKSTPNLSEDQIPKILDEIFTAAIGKHASDIHFKPIEDKFAVYFRIDGQMIKHAEFEASFQHPLVARIKIISGLKIDEHRLPQDGKSSFTIAQTDVDLRVSILPTSYGEKVVIRLLEKNPKLVKLSDLGMLPNVLLKVRKSLNKSYGMILAVGPTGSGKSTSLFSMISTFDATASNISTLEDPIEYKIPNVTQSQINTEIGFDFSDGLRTLVRQDPDIIMVGEIRDQKTASLAVESALTGHLVFSTLHTNTAVGTIQRLLNMGIDRFLIAAAVKVIISQRLARKVCNYCRKKISVPKKYQILFREAGIQFENAFLYQATGCEHCNQTGYRGRIALFEVLEVSPNLEEMIIQNASSAAIQKAAIEEGMVELRQDALFKAITGDITIEEALRVIN